MDDRDSMSCSYTNSSSASRTRSMSVTSSTVTVPSVPDRIIEPLDYYSKQKFHPVHLMDTFQGTRYTVIRKLGYGSFSTVWLARDSKYVKPCKSDRYVALKIGHAESEPSPETGIYDKLAKPGPISHPGRNHYLPLLDHFRVTGPNGTHQALVYEPMGASVHEVKDALFPDTPFPLWTAKSILWQTLLTLDFMLANDVVHGDVQPRNLLFTLDDLAHVPMSEMSQDKEIPVTRVFDTNLGGGITGPEYLVAADSLMQYIDISRPFTIKISDLGGSFLTSNPPKTPSPPLHLRGPETLFQGLVSSKQDMWSFGCLIFEFLTGTDLFDLTDYPVSEITDDMHFIDMYNILGLPTDTKLRDTHWPNWREFFGPNGARINHYNRKRGRDFDSDGRRTAHTLEGLLKESLAGRFSGEELQTTIHLLRGLLEFNPEKRFTTKDVLAHRWFEEFRGSVLL